MTEGQVPPEEVGSVVSQDDRSVVSSSTSNTTEEKTMVSNSGRFIFDVAAEVYSRLGGRPNSSAQLKAAKILACRIMKEHGHRPMHVQRDIHHVMLLLVTPDAMEQAFDAYMALNLEFDPAATSLTQLTRMQPRRN
jgi:hypothetical protein